MRNDDVIASDTYLLDSSMSVCLPTAGSRDTKQHPRVWMLPAGVVVCTMARALADVARCRPPPFGLGIGWEGAVNVGPTGTLVGLS